MKWTYMETIVCILGGAALLWFLGWAYFANRELKKLYDELMNDIEERS